MIEKYAHLFQEKIAPTLLKKYSEEHPASYEGIFKDVLNELKRCLSEEWKDEEDSWLRVWDSDKIHVIDDGEYQGTRVFLVPQDCYQPSSYLMCKVGYGSCSGCDTFEGIRDYSHEKPTEQQAKDYVQLALHMVQAMKEV